MSTLREGGEAFTAADVDGALELRPKPGREAEFERLIEDIAQRVDLVCMPMSNCGQTVCVHVFDLGG